MEVEGSEDDTRLLRAKVGFASVIGKTVADFATAKSRRIFERLNLPSGFLEVAPEEWTARDGFKQAEETVQCLRVVNDNAERGVALIQQLSGRITQDEVAAPSSSFVWSTIVAAATLTHWSADPNWATMSHWSLVTATGHHATWYSDVHSKRKTLAW